MRKRRHWEDTEKKLGVRHKTLGGREDRIHCEEEKTEETGRKRRQKTLGGREDKQHWEEEKTQWEEDKT